VPTLRINEDKTVLATRRYRRQITGLVLTLDDRISIGRERKRELRAALHHFSLGKLSEKQIVHLAGLMAFVRDVEPEFFVRMEKAYGTAIFDGLKQAVKDYRRDF
jgi:RNA-directed DNA polymerase